jgi:hypothetical protein
MDDLVLRGMARWPDVPAVYGWLELNRRGEWLIKGEAVSNPVVSAYISRNYEHDAQGRWYFQNGPQRVFVTLDYTPIVYRVVHDVAGALVLESHMGKRAQALSGAWLDETGALIVQTESGTGVVHDRDLETLVPAFTDANGSAVDEDQLEARMDRVQQGGDSALCLAYGGAAVKLEPLRSRDVPRRFGFDPSPTAPGGHPQCA